MKEISQEEFEKYILDLITKKITRVELAKELHTDTRTLNNKIYAIENEELLKKYIEVYPYKPKKNENVNYEALLIEIIKNNESVKGVLEKYNIAERTYRRNVRKLKISNNKLYTIYKNYISRKMQEEDIEYINSIPEEKVTYSNSVEDRKAQLMQLFCRYDNLIDSGISENLALLKIEQNKKSIKRKNDELERILREEKISKKSKTIKKSEKNEENEKHEKNEQNEKFKENKITEKNEANEKLEKREINVFKQSLKVDISNIQKTIQIYNIKEETTKNTEKSIEGEEK